MSRPLVCPCGSEFYPRILKDPIQLLCDSCAIAHHQGQQEVCEAWVSASNVVSLFGGFAAETADSGTAGDAVRGVEGVTPVPLRGGR